MKHLMFALLLLMLSSFAVAQESQSLTDGTGVVISGKDHPEQIPDEAAAEAVFSVHSLFDGNSEKHHNNIGLSQQDHAAYELELRDFRRVLNERKKNARTPEKVKDIPRSCKRIT